MTRAVRQLLQETHMEAWRRTIRSHSRLGRLKPGRHRRLQRRCLKRSPQHNGGWLASAFGFSSTRPERGKRSLLGDLGIQRTRPFADGLLFGNCLPNSGSSVVPPRPSRSRGSSRRTHANTSTASRWETPRVWSGLRRSRLWPATRAAPQGSRSDHGGDGFAESLNGVVVVTVFLNLHDHTGPETGR